MQYIEQNLALFQNCIKPKIVTLPKSSPRRLVSAHCRSWSFSPSHVGHKPYGFTLLELMMVLGIAAILLTLAAPSLTQLVQTNTMSSTVNTFLADMRYARSESIRRGGGVVMCRSNNSEAAAAVCDSGSALGWESGWIVFHDLDNNGTRLLSEPVLRVHAPIATVNSISEAGAATIFKFTATGRLAPTSVTQLQFGSSPVYTAETQRTVCVNLGGHARVALDSDGRPTGSGSCRY